jgi:glutamyl-tRNA synthetase
MPKAENAKEKAKPKDSKQSSAKKEKPVVKAAKVELSQKLKDDVYKYALFNAVKFNGKANPGALMGKILGENAEFRDKTHALLAELKIIVDEVNKMDVVKQTEKLIKIAPELLEKKEIKERELQDLPHAQKGNFVTRMPPEPSKYNHIGHALSFLINYMYAKKYEGKCVLRFDDTNPEKCASVYVDAMTSDVIDYLDIKPDRVVFASDDMPKMYELAEKLIHSEEAYVCFCDRDSMQKKRHDGIECDCRKKSPEQNLADWEKMKKGLFKEGECVLRLAIDMQALNHVMRDPVIFRLVYAEHYRQKNKYKVWPMYDFESSVEEELCGITHIMRSAEFGTMRVELQDYIKDLLKLKKQVVLQYGRFNIAGATTQGREVKQLIDDKKVIGWDDPRLVTLRALKRRGFVKQMYYDLVKEIGLNPSQINLDWKLLYSINRKILDPICSRYFFVSVPHKIKIEGAPKQDVELHLHPDKKEGGRKFKTAEEFYIEKADFDEMKDGELYRLMDCLNFRKSKGKFVFDSVEYEKYKDKGKKIIHWLPADQTVPVSVFMPDATTVKGLAEPGIKSLKTNDVIQFERFGFCRMDDASKLSFWYTHK